jgi:hypothetical protein
MYINENLTPQLNAGIRLISTILFQLNIEYFDELSSCQSPVTMPVLTGKYIKFKKQPANLVKRYVDKHTK